MSEPEFEMYLSLMSKFLRLTGAQKADIAEELRIHLEERLAELTAQGKTREEAIRLALDEFGDAGALAWQFTLPHSQRRRRQLMRYSIGTFAALAGIFTLVSLTWPTRQDMPPALSSVVAQGEPQPAAAPPDQPVKPDMSESIRRELEQKLDQFIVSGLQFEQMPLHEALQFLEEVMTLSFIVDPSVYEPYKNSPITLIVRQDTPIRGKTALELVFRQLGDSSIDYVIKDGVILITNNEEEYEVQVYDCRDLLAGVLVQAGMTGEIPSGGMGGGGGGFFSIPAELAQGVLMQPGAAGLIGGKKKSQAPSAMGAGMQGRKLGAPGMAANANPPAEHHPGAATSSAGAALIRVIQNAARPAEWVDIDGSGGSLSEFDGVLIVQHHQSVHRKIEDVLAKLRKVKHGQLRAALQPAADAPPFVIPLGKRLVTLRASNWEVPVNALKPGSRVDVLRFFDEENDEGEKKHEVILSNAEVVLPNVSPLTINGFIRPTTIQISSVNLIVSPEEAVDLHRTELITPYPLKFLLRGEDDDEEDAPKAAESAAEEDEDAAARLLKTIIDGVSINRLASDQVERTIRETVEESLRDRIQVKVEPMTVNFSKSRFYPMVGPAQLLHVHYRCTVDYSGVDRCDRPQKLRDSGGSTLVVYQDHDHLIRAPQ